MAEQWQYQIRITLGDAVAETARRDPGNSAIAPLAAILAKHHATLKCQFDAFADYVADAEKHGTEKYPLYAWTKATIENGAKKKKYIRGSRRTAPGAWRTKSGSHPTLRWRKADSNHQSRDRSPR